MTITLAQFLHSFRGKAGAKRTILAEIEYAYEAGGVINTRTIYLSDRSYRTLPTDSPANVRYRDVISMSPTFERSIDLTLLGGRGRISVGSLTLDNCDGAVDFLLEVIIDGREIRFYAGEQGWARADFRLVNVAVVEAVKAPNTDELVIELADKNYLLDDTIIGDTMATGPNAGKPKPILLGSVKNFDVTPYLFDSSALKYYINNFALNGTSHTSTYLSGVRDNGVSLDSGWMFVVSSGTMTADAGTDTLTKTTHGLAVNDVVLFIPPGGIPAPLAQNTQYWVIAAGLTADNFRLSLTKGGSAIDLTTTTFSGSGSLERRRFYIDTSAATIELSGSPAGRVTIDMDGEPATGGNLLSVPHGLFGYVLVNYTGLGASEYDSAGSIADLYSSELSAPLTFGMAILDRTNVLDVLDAIALATYSWYAWNASGVLTVGRLDLVNLDAASSIDTITTTDIEGDLACENLPLSWGKVFLDAVRNVVVQSPDEMAGSVVASQRSQWGQQFQTRVSTTDPATATYLANWWDYHKSAIDSPPIATWLTVGMQAVCDAITALFGPWTRAYRCTVGVDKYALNPGDCVTLTHPRFGLSAGKKVRVMAVRPRFSEGLCDLVMVRKVTPDYTNATY